MTAIQALTQSHLDAQTIVIAGIAFTTFSTALLNIWQQHVLNKVKKTGDAIHVLTNSAMGSQLQYNVDSAIKLAVTMHRLADYTQQPEAMAAALAADVDVERAKIELQAHMVRQAKADTLAAVR